MTAAHSDWRRHAACTSHDPELFFPIGSTGPALAQLEQARQVCRSCPARLPCLEWAIDVGINDGIWGGLSETERQSLRRRRRSGRLGPPDLLTAADAVVTPRAASRLRTLNAANLLQPHRGRENVSAPPTPPAWIRRSDASLVGSSDTSGEPTRTMESNEATG